MLDLGQVSAARVRPLAWGVLALAGLGSLLAAAGARATPPAAAATAPQPSRPGEATFSFTPKTVQLAARAGSGEAALVLTAAAALACAGVPTVEDVGVPGDPRAGAVHVGFRAEAPMRGASNTSWLVHVKAENVPPAINQTRFARVGLGRHQAFAEYTLTNIDGAFRWTVQSPPPTWSLADGRDIPFAVTVGAVKATGVHLVSCTLVEKTSGAALDCGHFELCTAASPARCGRELELEAQRSHALLLRVHDGFREPGNYSGVVTIGADEVGDAMLPAAMQMTVNSTSGGRQAVGVLVILAGIAAAFWVTVYRRNKMLRDQALIAPALLGKKLEDLRGVLASSPIPAGVWAPQETRKRIDGWLKSLTVAELAKNHYIPSSFPNPTVSVDGGTVTAFLQGVSDSLKLLTAIVQEGFHAVWPHWQAATPAQQAQMLTVLGDIDGLAAIGGLAPADAQARIQSFLDRLRPPAAAAVALFAAAPPPPAQPPALAVVNLDLNRLNLYGWAAWLVLTLAAASAALILTNPGFGTFSDYVQCFLWSFGLAAAGQLTTLSFGSVSSALGFSLSKP
jgi:hypothetical protein